MNRNYAKVKFLRFYAANILVWIKYFFFIFKKKLTVFEYGCHASFNVQIFYIVDYRRARRLVASLLSWLSQRVHGSLNGSGCERSCPSVYVDSHQIWQLKTSVARALVVVS